MTCGHHEDSYLATLFAHRLLRIFRTAACFGHISALACFCRRLPPLRCGFFILLIARPCRGANGYICRVFLPLPHRLSCDAHLSWACVIKDHGQSRMPFSSRFPLSPSVTPLGVASLPRLIRPWRSRRVSLLVLASMILRLNGIADLWHVSPLPVSSACPTSSYHVTFKGVASSGIEVYTLLLRNLCGRQESNPHGHCRTAPMLFYACSRM